MTPKNYNKTDKWAPSREFVSSSIPSWQILTAHAQTFRGARDLAFCLKVPLDSLLVWASSEGSGETARMRRLAWTFAARIGDKYQIRLTRSKCTYTVFCTFWLLTKCKKTCFSSTVGFLLFRCFSVRLLLLNLSVEPWFICFLFWCIDEFEVLMRTKYRVCLLTTIEHSARVALALKRKRPSSVIFSDRSKAVILLCFIRIVRPHCVCLCRFIRFG